MKALREMNPASRSVTTRSVLAGVALACSMALPAAAQDAAAAADPATAHWALLQQNCEGCHNSTDWAGGVAFDTLTPDGIADDAETWEMAVRKLRGHLMPPPGEKQPAAKDVNSFVGWLEGRLDAAAATAPAPGEVGVHRLNRTEYARSIKAMLGLDVDVTSLLPKDVSMDGFDNIAAVLRTSPAFLEQYIGAARTISRQAIGRVDAKSSSHEFRVPTYLNQNAHIDGLPLGTRGGFTVDFWFAADGEYEFNIRDFLWMGAGYVTKVDSRHDVILTIDDQRVFQASAGGPEDLKAVDQRQAEAADEMQARFNHIRVKVKAGQRRVGVAFIQRSFAESDSILRPIAALPEMERVPRIPGLEISGPFNVTGLGDTESRRRIFICKPATPADEAPCARTILSHIAQQAFRRPVTDEDLKAPLGFYAAGREQDGFEGGIEAGLTAILSSTKFLFRTEQLRPGALVQARADAKVRIAPLDDLAIAARLSFFLWSEGPDQQLITAAQAGKLREPAGLHAEVSRMLKDPRSRSLVNNFAFQWLNVSRMDNIEPQQELYPDFDTNLRTGLREEIRLFLDSVLLRDRSVLDLLASDRTFLNERVALHYGIRDVRGAQFREVKLADANRFGLLGKAALMMSTSYGNRTSPVLRGAFILDNIMGTPPSPPPPGVETDLATEVGKVPATVRARLEQHRAAPSCNACHGVIDPLGFALENYDVTGAWRTRDLDANAAIDSGGGLGDAKASSPAELSRALLARPDQFVQALTERLMTFALGRSLVYRDMPTIRAIVRNAAAQRYTFESLIQGVVESPAFRMKEVLVDTPATQTASNSPEHPR
jgi:mono/diheme cytochrome c family protein